MQLVNRKLNGADQMRQNQDFNFSPCRSQLEVMLLILSDYGGVAHSKIVPDGSTVN